MVIILDENISLALAGALRQTGHEVIAIDESAGRRRDRIRDSSGVISFAVERL